MPDFATYEDFNVIHELIYSQLVDAMRQKADAAPVVLCFKMGEGLAIEKLTVFDVRMLLDEETGDKDVLAGLIFKLAAQPDHDIVAAVLETWYVSGDGLQNPPPNGSIADRDDKREAFIVQLYSKHEQYFALHPIDRENNRIERGELLDGANSSGRFVREDESRQYH